MNLLTASILPVIILMIYFYRRDRFEKEPVKSLAKAFFGGVLSVFLTLLMAIPLFPAIQENSSQVYNAFAQSFGQAAIPEEISKFAMLYLFIWRDKNFNEYYDGILYAVFVALGFACLENIMYVMQYGMGTAISRGFLAVPFHALCGVVMGYYFSFAKFTDRKISNLLKALFFAVMAHGTYDFILFYAQPYVEIMPYLGVISFLVIFVFVGLLWKNSLKKINRHVNNSVFKGSEPAQWS